MRALVSLLVAACAAGCGSDGPPAADAPRVGEAELVEIAAEAECARLRAGDPPGAVEAHLAEALRKRARLRDELDDAARAFPGAAARVDEKVAACRAAAGFSRAGGDGGVLWEKLRR